MRSKREALSALGLGCALGAAALVLQLGDGKILVTSLEHAVDIQTDETDSETI
jgi:nitrogen regulatory protein PII